MDKAIDFKFGATAGGSHKFKVAPSNASTPITPSCRKDRSVP